MEVSQKLAAELLQDPMIPLLGTYPEKTNQRRCALPCVHSSTVHNSQDAGVTSMPIDR